MNYVEKGKKSGHVTIHYVHKLTKKLSTCEFNLKKSIPGLYPTLREIISCFSEYGIEIHNYDDQQDRRFQKALLSLTKEFTEFFGTLHLIKGADKKELLIMLVIDVFTSEIEKSKTITEDSKQVLLSDVLLSIFEELLRKTIISVLMFKDIVNEEFSRKEFRSCMSRYFCCCGKQKKYLK